MFNEDKPQNPQTHKDDHNNGRGHDDDDRREPPGRVIHPRPTHGEPMRGRLDQSKNAMATEYPMFTYNEEMQSGLSATWRGCVQPIRSQDAGTRLLLDDLAHDRPVYLVGDEIRHLPGCTERHCEHAWMNQDLKLERHFDLYLKYMGVEALPRCYVLSPTLEKLKHTWGDGAICAFMDSGKNWRRGVDTVADFMPHVLIWLVKWMVFEKSDVWIGSEHYSAPLYHLQTIRRNDLCWCGSGLPYRRCHRIQDQIDAGLAPPKKLLRPSAIENLRWIHRH
jgi:hypothetical protein